jgi:pimeloyl-ACP methyl ester carboxylesterase
VGKRRIQHLFSKEGWREPHEDVLARHARNGFEVIRIPGTSHHPMIENPEALYAALEGVLRKIRMEIPMLT